MTDSIDVIKLIALSEKYPGYTHEIYSTTPVISEIPKTNIPGSCKWIFTEASDNYSVYFDSTYGRIALFENDILLGISEHCVYSPGVIAFNKKRYGVSKYIWR